MLCVRSPIMVAPLTSVTITFKCHMPSLEQFSAKGRVKGVFLLTYRLGSDFIDGGTALDSRHGYLSVWSCCEIARMGHKSAIEWTDTTWNPVTGCTKVTRGCDNCYAERLAERFRGTPGHPYEMGFDLTLRPERLSQPLSWKRPRMIFVNSMSDLFHKDIPTDFIDRVFDTMEMADWHIYQILTKRSPLMRDYLRYRYGPSLAPQHIWCGVSVEDSRAAARIQHLRDSPISIRFLSIEPLLGPVGDVDMEGVSWVIVVSERAVLNPDVWRSHG